MLNTNTRYLHDSINRYAERLAATLPEPLRVCFFVNSGSEANDLALRLARAATGQFDMITLDVAYHGHTQALIEVSPYKHDGPGGQGRAAVCADRHHARPLPRPLPRLRRGERPRAMPGTCRSAVEAIQAQGRGVAGFICESLMGCGGQIVFPDGFMAAAFDHVRAAGGICIADEVQTGLGARGQPLLGLRDAGRGARHRHRWQAGGQRPSAGGGDHDGGNCTKIRQRHGVFQYIWRKSVSCEIGLAVLDVIEQERLQANALDVGNYLMARLRALMDDHPLIGDVRGLGLYIGVELVLDRETREPAGEQRQLYRQPHARPGVLISTDGPVPQRAEDQAPHRLQPRATPTSWWTAWRWCWRMTR